MEAIQPDASIAEERDSLRAQVQELEARCAQLEQQLAAAPETVSTEAAPAEASVTPAVVTASDELEAYRRAERAERIASDRVAQLYNQANGALADATAPAHYQFLRLGYFCVDNKDSKPGAPVFNRSVSLKDSFKF